VYHLDTNTCVYALKGTFPAIQSRMRELDPGRIRVPSMVRGELLLAAEKSQAREKTLRQIERFLRPLAVVPFDEAAATHYARVRAELERRGEVIGPNDLVIAATVLAHGGVLVTHNVREFRRVDGLALEDWTVASDATP
jgi:tRNA(fMet)-specific endonuclease VapC